MSSFCFYDKLDVDKLQFFEALSGEAAYLLPGRRWMPEGQTEVERRYLKYGKKPVQMQKTNIFARIPLPPQCAHWGTFPPGEGFVTASHLPHKLHFAP